jgi:tetratricopeptide (TPR) repeat protein
VFIYQQEDKAPPAMVTAHEICHTFGAFHVEANDSLMHPYAIQGLDQTNFDQYTARQMEVMRDFDHAKGIDSLSKDQIDKCATNFADGHMSGDSFCVVQALVGRGQRLINTDIPGAITEFRKAAGVEGQAPDFMLIGRLGEALQLDGQLVQAAEMFRRSEPLKLEQTIAAKGHRLLGGHLEDLMNDEIAFIGCQQPAKPTLPEIYERRVRERISPDEMLTQYREAVKAEPENDYSHFRLGKALLLCGANDEALAEYEQAITLKPSNDWYKTQLEVAKMQIAARAH